MELHEISLKTKMYILSKIAEVVENGVVVTNPDGTIIYVNPYTTLLTGYSEQELLGENPRLFKSGIHNSKFYEKMWKEISAGKRWTGKIVNKHKTGRLWTELVTIHPVTNANDEIEFYIAIQQTLGDKTEKTEKAEKKKG